MGPLFFIGSIVKIGGGETCTPGRPPRGVPVYPLGPLVGFKVLRAEWGQKTGKSVHNIISLFPCKAGVVSCSYSSIYIDWLIALLSLYLARIILRFLASSTSERHFGRKKKKKGFLLP